MSFSVSICLTNQGTQSLGPTLTLYSNPISQLNPGNFIRTVPKTSITGANCPFTFLAPLGTQTIRIFDPLTFCYVDIPVGDNNVCNTCDLGLSNITNNVLGQINVGSLTGTCDFSIDDYSMSWYGPDSSTNLAFTSGQGTLFSSQYQYTQPLTSGNSPVLNPGVYVGRINNVSLNGLNFSSTGGTGNITSCTLTSCTTNVTVATYSCLNGTPLTTDGYGHYRNFSYNGSQPPSILNTKLQLSAGTQYVVFKFVGYNVYDTIKFTLSGNSYPSPIQLEEISVGGYLSSNNFNPSTWPKSAVTSSFFKKIINLTGFTISNNDIIDIKITPNPTTYETNWQLYFGCSTKPTGSKTCLDTYKNTPYKIKTSTIPSTLSSLAGCPTTYSLSFSVSGCNSNDNYLWTNSNLYKFGTTDANESNIDTSTSNNLRNLSFGNFYDNYGNISSGMIFYQSQTCQSSVGTDYRIEKTVGSLKFYFKNINDLYTFGNSFNYAKTTATNYSATTGTYTTNNADIDYYRAIRLIYKTNDICGDGASSSEMDIPVNTTIVTGTTTYSGYTHYMTLTIPTSSYSNTACPSGNCGCSTLSGLTNTLNNTRNNVFTSTRTKLLTNPFYYSYYHFSYNVTSATTSTNSGSLSSSFSYSDKTYPSSGGTNNNTTLLPTLSATTWDWTNHFYESGNGYAQYVYYYEVRAKTPLTSLGFEIWGYTITNYTLGTSYKIYDSTTGGIVPGRESFFV